MTTTKQLDATWARFNTELGENWLHPETDAVIDAFRGSRAIVDLFTSWASRLPPGDVPLPLDVLSLALTVAVVGYKLGRAHKEIEELERLNAS